MTGPRDHKPIDEEAATRLETLLEDGPGSSSDASAAEEVTVGDFRIIRELGSGGMGRVFLAQQLEPVERRVALKLIHKRVLNRRTLARFEVERQALASMQHPAIAQVYDAGTTPQGYPWFAMEYIEGEPLDRYCSRNRLPPDQRLDLFMRICQGVQHAHLRGIIHRDLKPANILVTRVDGVAQPKIIDFGIATAAREDSDDPVLARELAGTPEYMSPEQFADGDGIIDTRSDVYSLGVILYELLVDQPPVDRRYFRSQQRPQFSSLPNGGSVPSPSTRLAESTDRRDEIAHRLATRYHKLQKYLRGDLDAIVLKALQPERDNRYTTPAELGEDLARHLNSQPVKARVWSPGYRMGKFARRHAVALGSASAVLLALLTGLAAATFGMIEAQRQYQIAETRSIELEQVAAFQQSMLEEIDPAMMGFGIIDGLRRQVGEGLERTGSELSEFEDYLAHVNASDLAREVVDEHILQRALTYIERDFADQPLLSADLLQSVFMVYMNVGRVEGLPELGERMVALRESVLAEDDHQVLDARRLLGRAWFVTAHYENAAEQLEHVIDLADDTRPEHLQLLARTLGELAMVLVELGRSSRAIELATESITLAERAFGRDEVERFNAHGTMGYVLARSGNTEAALEHFQHQLDGYLEMPDVSDYYMAHALSNLAAALGSRGRLEESLEANREAVELLERARGRRHPITLRAMANLANTLHRSGEHQEAIVRLEEAVRLRREVMGPTHPLTLRAMLNLASVYTHQDQHDPAMELIEVVAEQRARQLGENHLDTLTARELLANIHVNRGAPETALPIIEPVYQARKEILGEDHQLVQDSGWVYGLALLETGQSARAEPFLSASVDHSWNNRGPEHPVTLRMALTLYQTLLEMDKHESAQQARETYLALFDQPNEDQLNERQEALYREFLELDR